jgi:hypothetical protein
MDLKSIAEGVRAHVKEKYPKAEETSEYTPGEMFLKAMDAKDPAAIEEAIRACVGTKY